MSTNPPPDTGLSTLALPASPLELVVTPQLGGRVLHLSLPGQPNLLRVGEEVEENPSPNVSPAADFIGYEGHTVWLGPQRAWWTQQSVNPERAAAASLWPPDPYLDYGPCEILEHSDRRLVLEGVESPVSGVRLRKTFETVGGDDTPSLRLTVEATNVRETPVSWDLWFNTRTAPGHRVYVPVATREDWRIENREEPSTAGLVVDDRGGFVTFDLAAPLPAGKTGRKGKVFIQPSAGWIAAFDETQCLLIRFPLEPRAAIHPDQGQVELYLERTDADRAAGLLELEVHAPYRTLAPGDAMRAEETWTVLPYAGPDTPAAHRAFLAAHVPAVNVQ